MRNLKREDIYIITKHSNVTETIVSNTLKTHIYNDKDAWQKFIRVLLITLAVGFTVTGIIFFFAYNWANLHKFTKLGLTQGLLLVVFLVALLSKLTENTKNILFTGVSALVGVLFAVYGQVYQTGANAYDFFLGWTIFITIWVVVINFSPLWLLYILLVNTTIILYAAQIAKYWDELLVFNILLVINSLFLIAFNLFNKQVMTNWFRTILSLALYGIATLGISISIFDDFTAYFGLLLLLTLGIYALGIWDALKNKNTFYIALTAFSLITIICSLLIHSIKGDLLFFAIGLTAVLCTTATVIGLVKIQRSWNNEN